jgi:hypothetical protein
MALANNLQLSVLPTFSEIVEVHLHEHNVLETLEQLDRNLVCSLHHPVKLSRSVRLSR